MIATSQCLVVLGSVRACLMIAKIKSDNFFKGSIVTMHYNQTLD